MEIWLQFGIGATLTIAGWLITRWSAGARLRQPSALALDAIWPMIGFGLALAVTARPILAGILVVSLGAGLMLADRAKRAALREPVVFSDMDEFLQLFRHPQLYLPFAGTGRVIGGALGTIGALAALWLSEPPIWASFAWPGGFALAAGLVAVWSLTRQPLTERIAAGLKDWGLSGDPAQDAARLGLLAMLFAHGMIARAERPSRRSSTMSAVPQTPARMREDSGPLIVVQSESFFDARRLHPAVPRNLLPAYDAFRASALQWGNLAVPGWGANTMRTEFAALTGLTELELGFDRFNPYHAFARRPVHSLASRLRHSGYRTVCVHPFDRRFFRRDLAMANLGFDAFLGPEAFVGATRSGRYVTDIEVARRILEVLRSEGPRVFIFAITMENHGPWVDAAEGPQDRYPELAGLPHAGALQQYLDGLRAADRMLELLARDLQRIERGVLAFYGDHLPSLPSVFDALGFEDSRTDYFIWRPEGCSARHCDLFAHQLPEALLSALVLDAPRADRAR